MSAINGICHFNQEIVPLEHGINMMKALEQFPADDVQTWYKDPIFLGCHAQWITPESIGEKLPYYDNERRLAITSDAIIDNREDLFDRLQVEHSYTKTITDSELILLSYHKWGEESPKYLIGDFAFMIWDERNRILFGARDFSGSRTLYFHRSMNRFAFCTTIQPLFSLPYVDKRLNEQWLAEFLAHPGMIDSVDSESTVYQKIEQVPPSHFIRVNDGRVTLSEYSTITAGERLKLKSNGDYEEAFRDVFQRAVTSRLRTHHKVGALLSGGLDSGSVASFAARALEKQNKRLYTYSYVPVDGFTDWTSKYVVADERPYIRATVQHVGNITDQYLDFSDKSSFTEVDDLLDTLEMPYKFFENSYWIKGIYEKANQQGLGMLLNGARGNFTISWGPALDYYAVLLKRLNWVRLYREINLYSNNKGIGRSQLLTAIRRKAFPFMDRIKPSDVRDPFPLMVNPELARRTDVFKKLQDQGVNVTGYSTPSANLYKIRKKSFEQSFAWNMNGTSATKLSLRYSLWNRDPTNDIRVIRFCLSVPEDQCVQNGLDRSLIRRSTEHFLPDQVRLNQRIRGIQGADGIHRMAPSWKTIIEELQQMCIDPNVSGLLNIPVIQDAISKFRETPRPQDIYDMKIAVLMRSLILYRFMKKMA
jgi:asparagine synthase (glutamine-hydrolysing)